MPALKIALTDEDWWVVEAAASALMKLVWDPSLGTSAERAHWYVATQRWPEEPVPDPAFLEPLGKAIRAQICPKYVEDMLVAIGSPSVPLLLEALNSRVSPRENAVPAIVRLGVAAIPGLIAMKHFDEAVKALGEIGLEVADPYVVIGQIVPALLSEVDSGNSWAIRMLCKLRSRIAVEDWTDTVVPVLSRQLQGGSRVLTEAADALRTSGWNYKEASRVEQGFFFAALGDWDAMKSLGKDAIPGCLALMKHSWGEHVPEHVSELLVSVGVDDTVAVLAAVTEMADWTHWQNDRLWHVFLAIQNLSSLISSDRVTEILIPFLLGAAAKPNHFTSYAIAALGHVSRFADQERVKGDVIPLLLGELPRFTSSVAKAFEYMENTDVLPELQRYLAKLPEPSLIGYEDVSIYNGASAPPDFQPVYSETEGYSELKRTVALLMALRDAPVHT